MSGEHTPGPWHVGADRPQVVYDADGFRVVDFSLFPGPGAPDPSEERLANARLTAAAPDMIRALKVVAHHHSSSPYIGLIRAAIARAEGGAQ